MKTSPKSLAQNLMKPKYQSRSDGGNHSLPEMLQNKKWDPGVPKWPTGSGKGLTSRVLCTVISIFSRFYDRSSNCIRNVDSGEKHN